MIMKNIGFLCEYTESVFTGFNQFNYKYDGHDISKISDEVLEWVVSNKIDTLVCTSKQIGIGSRVLWMAPCLKRYFITDSNEPLLIEVSNKRVQAKMWDMIASHSEGNSLKQTGWISSYTNELFSIEEMKEYVDNAVIKLNPYITSGSKVLEIGIASGLTCFEIAPMVESYIGIDISKKTLEKTEVSLLEKGLMNVTLALAEAIDVDKLNIKNQDIIIINSVLQYFAGYNYFIAVIKKSINCMKEGGVIFLGDILDYDLRDDLKQELIKRGKKENNRNDLYYSKSFMQELPAYIPEITKVEIGEKIGTIENELKKYRYDVILHIDKNCKNTIYKKTKFQYAMLKEGFSIQDILESEGQNQYA